MEEQLSRALQAEPTDQTAWLALADWLEESGQSDRAELLRLRTSLTSSAEDLPRRDRLEARLRQLVRARTTPPIALWQATLNRKTVLPLSLIPAGEFIMGSPPQESHRSESEGPQHLVRISKPFWLGITPVTQAQFKAVMKKCSSRFTGEDRPADMVDWPTAEDFCRRLTKRLGQTCRLPYESEWEYACRAGTTTMFYTGRDAKAMHLAGWCSKSGNTGSAGQTKPVAQYLPNAFGLYDMHGNVREWCHDDMRPYTAEPQTDPRGPETGNERVVRGGSWYYGSEDSRSACRYPRPMDYRLDYYGFRVLVEAE
jgi:uncharacterized protein (TIGR02996 family)